MRILSQPLLGIGDTHHSQQLDSAEVCISCTHSEMELQRLYDLKPDRQDRIERGHGLLEDHGDLPASDVAHLFFRKREQVAVFELNTPFRNAAGARQKPHDRVRGNRLSGA